MTCPTTDLTPTEADKRSTAAWLLDSLEDAASALAASDRHDNKLQTAARCAHAVRTRAAAELLRGRSPGVLVDELMRAHDEVARAMFPAQPPSSKPCTPWPEEPQHQWGGDDE